MYSSLRAATVAVALLAATIGLRNWAVASTPSHTGFSMLHNGSGDPPPPDNFMAVPSPIASFAALAKKNGSGDPPPPDRFSTRGIASAKGIVLALNGSGDPPPPDCPGDPGCPTNN
ncbi:MAG TPA: hypothetical protein VN515_00900 [Terriglobales bacterium]|nr:hypothetical protein [Terriglobales bacterium]